MARSAPGVDGVSGLGFPLWDIPLQRSPRPFERLVAAPHGAVAPERRRAAVDVEAVVARAACDRLKQPDVAIVDIRMPPTHTDEGLVATQRIRADHPMIGVLVLSQYVEPSYAVTLLEEHPERVGYLLKQRVVDVAVLVDALRRIGEGETVVDPTIGSRLVGRQRRHDPLGELTAREREALGLVAEGLSNGAIASRLFVTERTVEAHVKQVFLKLGWRSTQSLTGASSRCSRTCGAISRVDRPVGSVGPRPLRGRGREADRQPHTRGAATRASALGAVTRPWQPRAAVAIASDSSTTRPSDSRRLVASASQPIMIGPATEPT
jgi:DNA-binding NarL/FixJ family response regulator